MPRCLLDLMAFWYASSEREFQHGFARPLCHSNAVQAVFEEDFRRSGGRQELGGQPTRYGLHAFRKSEVRLHSEIVDEPGDRLRGIPVGQNRLVPESVAC